MTILSTYNLLKFFLWLVTCLHTFLGSSLVGEKGSSSKHLRFGCTSFRQFIQKLNLQFSEEHTANIFESERDICWFALYLIDLIIKSWFVILPSNESECCIKIEFRSNKPVGSETDFERTPLLLYSILSSKIRLLTLFDWLYLAVCVITLLDFKHRGQSTILACSSNFLTIWNYLKEIRERNSLYV